MSRLAWSILAITSLTGSATAQTVFESILTTDQLPVSTPPSSATGGGSLILDPSSGAVAYEVELTGATGVTSARLHRGAPGETGPVVLHLAGGPTHFTGTSPPLGPLDVAALQSGSMYLQIDSTSHPTGELRGQVTTGSERFVVDADAAQLVPPGSGPASGQGFIWISTDHRLLLSIMVQMTTGSTLSANVRRGLPGENGPILVSLPNQVGSPLVFSSSSDPLPESILSFVRAGHAHITIATEVAPDSELSPGGELRGAIRPDEARYGESCGANGVAALQSITPIRAGEFFELFITGAPNSTALLFAGPAGASLPIGSGCDLLVAPNAAIIPFPTLGASGFVGLQTFIPGDLPAQWIQIQLVGADPLVSGALYTSHGIGLPVHP